MDKIKQFYNFKTMTKKKKIILFGSVFSIIALAVVFNFSSSSSDGMKVIPKNTIGVGIIDFGAIYNKADINEIRELDLVQDAIKMLERNIDDDKIIDIINDPNECGIDVKSEMYIFSSVDMQKQFGCASFGMDDVKKFENILDEYGKEISNFKIEENKDEKYKYIILDKKTAFAWDKEVLLLVNKINDESSNYVDYPNYPDYYDYEMPYSAVNEYDNYDDYYYYEKDYEGWNYDTDEYEYSIEYSESKFYAEKRRLKSLQDELEKEYENAIKNYEKEVEKYERDAAKPVISEIERLMTLDSDEKITKNSNFKDFYANKTDICLWISTDFAEDIVPQKVLSMGLKQVNEILEESDIDTELSVEDIFDNSIELFYNFGDGNISYKTAIYLNKNVRSLVEEISGIDPKELSVETVITFDDSGNNSLNAIIMGVYNVAIKVGDEMMEDIFYDILDEISYNNTKSDIAKL